MRFLRFTAAIIFSLPNLFSVSAQVTERENPPIYAIATNPADTSLAITGSDGLWIYDAESLSPVQQLADSSNYSAALAWSPDGTKIATYLGPEEGVAIYDVQERKISLMLSTFDYYTATVYTVSWSPDGTKLAAFGTTPTRVWDTETGDVLFEISDLAIAESVAVFQQGLPRLVTWSSDSQQLALLDGENIAIFDTTTWERTTTILSGLDRITSIDWSTRNELAVVAQAESIQVWDMQSKALRFEINLEGDHMVGQWSSHGTTLAVSGSRTVHFLNSQQQTVTTISQEALTLIYDLGWQMGDQYLIARGSDSSLYTWDTQELQLVAILMPISEE